VKPVKRKEGNASDKRSYGDKESSYEEDEDHPCKRNMIVSFDGLSDVRQICEKGTYKYPKTKIEKS
jgi:hypothetical protein